MHPVLTVVTVVYNAHDVLEATIQSVLAQTFPHIEYLVIDGGSTDGTLDIIKRYATQLSRWVSEPDKGIYDAMNKGIVAATGEWICFINAGDRFHTSTIVEDVFKNQPLTAQADVLYGDVVIEYPTFKRVGKAKEVSQLWKGMICSHQSLFTRTALLKETPFDTQFKLGADFDSLLGLYTSGRCFVQIPLVVADVSAMGQSDQHRVLSIQNWRGAALKYNGSFKTRFFFWRLLESTKLKRCLKNLMPKVFLDTILRLKYK